MKVKKRLLVSTLTMLCIMAQVGSPVALAASNKDITDLINDVGHGISIVIEEDIVQEQESETASKSKEQAKPKVTTKKANKDKRDTFSSDGRYYYGAYTGTAYKTTSGWTSHPELRKDLEDYLGYNALQHNTYTAGGSLWQDKRNVDLFTVYTRANSTIGKAMNNKTMKLKLGDIAVKNGLVNRNDTTASAHVALFTYYNIINTDDGLMDYKNTTKDYISRQQAYLVMGRFMHPSGYFDLVEQEKSRSQEIIDIMGEDNGYLQSIINYQGNMLLGSGESGFTKKEMESPILRIELIYTLIRQHFPNEYWEAVASKETSATYFSDIKKSDIVDYNKFEAKHKLQDNGYITVPGKSNKLFRAALKEKVLLPEYDAAIECAYNLGILKPTKDGKSNIWKKATMSQTLRFLLDSADAVRSGKAYN